MVFLCLAIVCLLLIFFQLCPSTLTTLSCLSAFEKQQYAQQRQFLQKLQFALFILFPTNKNVFIYLIMKYSAFDLFLGHQFQKGRSRPSCKSFYNNNSLKNLPNFFLATQSRCKLTRRSADQELRNIKADKMKKTFERHVKEGGPVV